MLAKERMNPVYWDFYAGGSDDERSPCEPIRRMPILVAPTSLHCMAHPEGECATAQGAGMAGALMIVSTDATRPLEEIAQAASGPLWFQLYIYHSLKVAAGMVRRAETAGYRAIVLTVDLPVMGNRERSKRHKMPLPPPPFVEANFVGVEEDDQERVPVTWETVDWLRSITALPILLKGIRKNDRQKLTAEKFFRPNARPLCT